MKSSFLTLEFLKSKCKIDRKTKCWNIIGDQSQRYPRINFAGIIMKASHAAFILKFKRCVKTGYCVMHKCDNTRCANPHHVKEGTHHQNRMDAVRKGRFRGWKLSIITRQRMSLARKGRPLSESAKKKLSAYKRTKLMRHKMSIAAKQRWSKYGNS